MMANPKPAPEANRGRPFDDMRATGLLWLINRVVFHPRGFALAFHVADGEVTGWSLLGDGAEVWRFVCDDEDKHFADVAALFREAALVPQPPTGDGAR